MIRVPFIYPMRCSLRAGVKTQTRRLRPRKLAPGQIIGMGEPHALVLTDVVDEEIPSVCNPAEPLLSCVYQDDWPAWQPNFRWRSSLFIPDWAVRTQLRVSSTRQEQLCSISEADARAEGFARVDCFRAAFEQLHPRAWESNPEVQVICFEVLPGALKWPRRRS